MAHWGSERRLLELLELLELAGAAGVVEGCHFRRPDWKRDLQKLADGCSQTKPGQYQHDQTSFSAHHRCYQHPLHPSL
jgi:hypothetical protein